MMERAVVAICRDQSGLYLCSSSVAFNGIIGPTLEDIAYREAQKPRPCWWSTSQADPNSFVLCHICKGYLW